MPRAKGSKRRTEDAGKAGREALTAPSPPPGVSHLDQHLAALAVKKMQAGEKLSRDETQSLRRFQRQQEEEQRWRYYRTIPAKHWKAMARRSAKTLQEQAGVYGIPFDGAMVDLPMVVEAMHSCFARYAYLFRGRRDQEGGGSGGGNGSGGAGEDITTTAERNKYLRLQQELKQIEIDKARRELISREELHQGLTRVASELRKALEILHNRFGPLAANLMAEKLTRIEAEWADILDPTAPASSTEEAA